MPIHDQFESHSNSLTGPIIGGFVVAPNDAADLPKLTRAIMVADGGDLGVVLKDGSTVILPGLTPGVLYPVRVSRVLAGAGGTTASGIVGLY